MDANGVTVAFEGESDRGMVSRLVQELGIKVGISYCCDGQPNLFRRLPGFNCAASRSVWFVFTDLDAESCAPDLVSRVLPSPSNGMALRVAVRATEAWLLADREKMAEWLGVRLGLVPREPDSLDNPKLRLVDLARQSRHRSLQSQLVPSRNSGRPVGPGYTTEINLFAQKRWRPNVAALVSPSLDRAIRSMRKKLEDSGTELSN